MDNKVNLNRCYESSYAPQDTAHNCKIWKYDQREDSYISTLAWRAAVNTMALPAIAFGVYALKKTLHEHNIIEQSASGLVQSAALIAIPLIAFKTKAVLKVNDAIYGATGIDWTQHDTASINNAIGYVKSFFSSDTETAGEHHSTHNEL